MLFSLISAGRGNGLNDRAASVDDDRWAVVRLIDISARLLVLGALVVGPGILTAACDTTSPQPPGLSSAPAPSPTTDVAPAYGPHVVHYQGVRELRFGDTERDLTDRGIIVRDVPQCGPRMATPTGVGPVFIDGRLALVWADPPLHTPEGISVGDDLSTARAAYPSAQELAAPTGSHRFNGLIANHGDRAYLFLHDGRIIQKLIAGYAKPARTLFEQGLSGC